MRACTVSNVAIDNETNSELLPWINASENFYNMEGVMTCVPHAKSINFRSGAKLLILDYRVIH